MIIDTYHFMTDVVSKFHRFVVVKGWFVHQDDWLVHARVSGPDVIAQVAEVDLPHPSVHTNDGHPRGFRIDCLRATDLFSDELRVQFTTNSGRLIEARLIDLVTERIVLENNAAMYETFQKAVSLMECPTVVDVGGRNRSKTDRGLDFPNCNYIVVDILPGENVDIVGDAHSLSNYLPLESADAVISAYTFEHLLMPWKVVIEMNRILKEGGIIWVGTHQTVGYHDFPWDFWRFSSDAWSGLFNVHTGFEIIETSMQSPQYVIPFWFRHSQPFPEHGMGFENTSVLARKIGPAQVDWPVPLQSIVATMYPDMDRGVVSEAHEVDGMGKPRKGLTK